MSDEPQAETRLGEMVLPSWGTRRVLLVDDEETICKYLRRELVAHGCEAAWCLSGAAALDALERDRFSVVVVDLVLPDMSGMEVVRHVRKRAPQTSVVVITAYGSVDSAIEAMKLGASDYVAKPFDAGEFWHVIERVFGERRLLDQIAQLRLELAERCDFENMISQDSRMREIFTTIARVAATDATVLISGETGTGKELVARAIHYNSPRRGNPFLAINCGAFPETLLESELFGHEQGAFTGAVATKPGIFEVANGGTLLLDEIGNISHAMQVKLLRVLETMEFKRVGGVETLRSDVRLLAATHVDLAAAVEQGTFRRDLFYRVNVVPIVLPPLRERVGDIPLLVAHFIQRHAPGINPGVRDISGAALRKLMRYPWPGNIRQLEHVIQRALVLAEGNTLLPEDLPLESDGEPEVEQEIEFNTQLPLNQVREEVVERLERAYLDHALRQYRGNMRETARHAGMTARALYEKLKRYGLDRRAYKARSGGGRR